MLAILVITSEQWKGLLHPNSLLAYLLILSLTMNIFPEIQVFKCKCFREREPQMVVVFWSKDYKRFSFEGRF